MHLLLLEMISELLILCVSFLFIHSKSELVKSPTLYFQRNLTSLVLGSRLYFVKFIPGSPQTRKCCVLTRASGACCALLGSALTPSVCHSASERHTHTPPAHTARATTHSAGPSPTSPRSLLSASLCFLFPQMRGFYACLVFCVPELWSSTLLDPRGSMPTDV